MSDSVEDRHSDQEFLDAVREHEPAATSEIAAIVGVARQRADHRLRKLEDEDSVTRKKRGNSLAWHLAEGKIAIHVVNSDDGFWDAETYEGEEMSVGDADDVIYGEVETE